MLAEKGEETHMAKPRIFISSTYYDLRYVREDLERFISSIGYEPIRHETGHIPYSKEVSLEESAYREVALSDVIVCIVGGRYGTESTTREGSITQNELEQALKKGVQVYVFVEQNVYSEYATYQLNKDNKETKYRFVDNVAVYQFLERLYTLPQNNPVTPFSTSADICHFLQTQWAGLFQRFLQEGPRISEMKVLEEMKSVASTLNELVNFLTVERRNRDDAIKNIILSNHPAFRAFAKLTGTNYKVYFTNLNELNAWLDARSYKPVDKGARDEGSVAEWLNEKTKKYIKLTHELFDDDGKLILLTESEWNEDWLQKTDYEILSVSNEEIPF